MRDANKKSLSAIGLAAALILLAVPALLLAQAPATSAAPPFHSMHGNHFSVQHLAKKLNLTEEQQATAKQLFQDLKAKMAPIHQAQQALHTQLTAALAVPNPDAATVGQVVIQMHQSRAQIKPVMEAFHQQFQALLNPDQLTQYKQMLAAKSASRHNRGVVSNPSQ